MVRDFTTVPEMLHRVCQKFNTSKNAFLYKPKDEFVSMNYSELLEKVMKLSISLLDLGIHKGDRVGIMSENRMEWILASFAINSIGAIDVPIFPVLTAKQAKYIFNESEVSAIFVSDEHQLKKILKVKQDIPSLGHVVMMDSGVYDHELLFVKTFDELIKRADLLFDLDEARRAWKKACKNVSPDDLLTIIYTSGTTGNPKGVMLTHRNVCVNTLDCMEIYGDFTGKRSLSFLPLCHTYERTAGFYGLFSHGSEIVIAKSVTTVAADLLEMKPTVITTVPRLLETVRKKILSGIDKEKPSKKAIINSALAIGIKYAKARQTGKVPFLLKQQYKVSDKLVFSEIRRKMGGLKMAISGGAPIADEVTYFFLALGVNIYQGYGLTEASPVVAVNGYDDNMVGTIGKPIRNVKVKLSKESELLVKGPSVMKGYWKDKKATCRAIDDEGWLYTGDIAEILPSGHIKITDRKKFIFVNSGGKNIAPQPIESLIAQSRYIEQCVLIGDNRDYNTALITPNYEQLRTLAKEFDIDFDNQNELISNNKIIKHIKQDIDFYQKDIAPFEKVRKFHILSAPFSVDNGELSPKLSVKRHVVEEKYAGYIANMYDSTANKTSEPPKNSLFGRPMNRK